MSTEPNHYTIPENLLLAAAEVAAKRSPWPISQLVVAAWQKWPETFGLHGYELKYPNANIVISAMSGKKGMVSRGLIERILPNVYKLTQTGSGWVEILKEDQGSPKRQNAYKRLLDRLNSELHIPCDPLIAVLKNSVCYIADCASRRTQISFGDARQFFDGQPRADVLRQLIVIGESEKPEAGEACALRGLADYLNERFARAWEIHEKVQVKA